jgi:non-canonical poly(A) RNA polymerase PAPD5/7
MTETLRDEEDWKEDDFLSFGVDSGEENDEEDDRLQAAALAETLPHHQQRDATALPPWMEEPYPSDMNSLVQLHNEIVSFCRLVEPLPEEIQAREELIGRISVVAKDLFVEPKIELFGSQATGLLLPSSDIDLVITIPEENWRKGGGDTESSTPREVLAQKFRADWLQELTYLEIIEQTKVPLVKLTHGPSRVSVDISFNQPSGPPAAIYMKQYLDALPPLRPLTFVLKYFLAVRRLNERYSGGIGSFLLQLMIVSFLQHRERHALNYRKPSLHNLGSLLLEFLELYGTNFNYYTTGITVRHDGFYFAKGSRERKSNFWNDSRPALLAMENPLDTSNDVGQGSFRMQMVQRSLGHAYKTLLAHLSTPGLTDGPSILQTIIPITEEMRERQNLKRRKPVVSAEPAAKRAKAEP